MNHSDFIVNNTRYTVFLLVKEWGTLCIGTMLCMYVNIIRIYNFNRLMDDTNLSIEQNENLSPDVTDISEQVADKLIISHEDDVEPGEPTEQTSLPANKTGEKCKLSCINFQSFDTCTYVQGKCNICIL